MNCAWHNIHITIKYAVNHQKKKMCGLGMSFITIWGQPQNTHIHHNEMVSVIQVPSFVVEFVSIVHWLQMLNTITVTVWRWIADKITQGLLIAFPYFFFWVEWSSLLMKIKGRGPPPPHAPNSTQTSQGSCIGNSFWKTFEVTLVRPPFRLVDNLPSIFHGE